IFSPILLLGIGGAWLLIKTRRYREFLVPLILLFSIVIGYAVLQGPDWYSGKGWRPRYLLPVVPFMCLWLLPVIDRLLDRRVPRWSHALFVGLAVYSVFVQIIGVIPPIEAFGDYLYHEGLALHREIAPWLDGSWNPLYIPPIVAAHRIG